MSVAVTDRITRGSENTSPFAVVWEDDIKISHISVDSLTDRDNLPEWRRLSMMTCYVREEDKTYKLGINLTIAGQVWTEESFGVPSNVLIDTDILDVDGYIQSSLIKNVFLNDSFIVADEAAMLATTSFTGNFFIRTDTSGVFVKLNDDDPSDISDFAEVTYPGAVLTVNGDTGNVVITAADLIDADLAGFNTRIAASTIISSHTADILALQNSISDFNTDISNKADLVLGTVPLSQLPYTFGNGLTDNGTGGISAGGTLGSDLIYSGAGIADVTFDVVDFRIVTSNSFIVNYDDGTDSYNLTANSNGLKYDTDLTASYSNLSLVHKEYVDGRILGSSISAPSFDAISMWDDTLNTMSWLTIGSGLNVSRSPGLITLSASGGGGVTTFLGLTDTDPATYVGTANQIVVVNGSSTGLTFRLLTGSDIPSLDASKITSGIIDINRIPAAALERVYVYAGGATLPENAGLTVANVQNGDTVKMNSTGNLYVVVDDTNLSSAASFVIYNAAVSWSSITGKPTTVAGFGISDAVSTGGSYTNPSWITSLAGSKLTGSVSASLISGVLDISNIPASAIERVYVYAGIQTLPENAGLTISNVQNGDIVRMNSTSTMYVVIDDTNLASSASFIPFAAGTAASVPWTGITSKPTTLAGYGITDSIFLRGGNSFGGSSIIGLTDNFDLTLQTGTANLIFATGGSTRMQISSLGATTFTSALSGTSTAVLFNPTITATGSNSIIGLNYTGTLTAGAFTPTLIGFNYNPTITGSPSAHYGVILRSGILVIGTGANTLPTSAGTLGLIDIRENSDADRAIVIRNSSNVIGFRLTSTSLQMGGGNLAISAQTNGSSTISGRGWIYSGELSTNNNVAHIFNITGAPVTDGSGTKTHVRFTNLGYSPTTGTGGYTVLDISPVLNITGGTQTVIGIDYNPNTTSLTNTTHYAMRTTSGTILNTRTSLGTTGADTLWLQTSTAAAVGAVQVSPSLVLEGQCWETTGGTSQSVKVANDILPVQGATSSLQWRLRSATNGGAYSDFLTISNSGIMRFLSGGSLVMQVTGAGLPVFSLGTSANGMTPISSAGTSSLSSSFGMQYYGSGGTTGTVNALHQFVGPAAAVNSWSATYKLLRLTNNGAIQPTSGTGGWTSIEIAPTLTITSPAIATIIAIDYNPTISGSNITQYGILIRTSAFNGFGLGATLPTAILDVAASTTARAAMRFRSGVAPSSPNDGDFWYDGTNYKTYVGGVTKTFTLV
jgi:hypothetical protein